METPQQKISTAIERLRAQVEHPQALVLRPEQREAVRQATERVAAQLLGEADLAFTIVLAGCTGAGKSTLINALAGARIASSSEIRPCTTEPTIYHHRDLPGGGLPEELATRAKLVPHSRPELRHKVIVDTPDLDSLMTENRETARRILKAAHLVIYVLTPERYHEERLWSIVHEEFRHSRAIAVLNKADLMGSREAAGILDDIRAKFALAGHADVVVLPVWAARHVPESGSGPLEGAKDSPGAAAAGPAGGAHTADDFLTLRAYITHELETSDMVRQMVEQRQRVVAHLRTAVESLVPGDWSRSLEHLDDLAFRAGADLGHGLAEQLDPRLATIESEQGPLSLMKAHQQFWGPFGAWLALIDFLRFELPRLGQHLRRWLSSEESSSLRLLITTGQTPAAADRLRSEVQRLQQYAYERDLPLGPWETITARPTAEELLDRLAVEVEGAYQGAAAARYSVHPVVTFTVSLVGWLVPAGLIVYVLIGLLQQVAELRFTHGLDLLGLMLTITILLYVVLHGLVDLWMITWAAGWNIDRQQPVRDLAAKTIDQWARTYRAAVAADIEKLLSPVTQIEEALAELKPLGR